ncbi:MAG: superinfection immunity protein [Caulobacterales bacterium]|nr:superinfection immunity protein [Caulobacterales bacterium]MCA0373724.1 superinfection immunity protein [Pseudomonadota bacterium]
MLLITSSEDTIIASYLILILLALTIYLLPTFISFFRNHHYKWIIFVCNLFGGWTGVLWILIFVWSIWPKEKTLIDPFVNNPTGTGRRTSGHTFAQSDLDYLSQVRHFNQNPRQQYLTLQQPVDIVPQQIPNIPNELQNLPKATLLTLEYLQRFRQIGAISKKQYNREKRRILAQ